MAVFVECVVLFALVRMPLDCVSVALIDSATIDDASRFALALVDARWALQDFRYNLLKSVNQLSAYGSQLVFLIPLIITSVAINNAAEESHQQMFRKRDGLSVNPLVHCSVSIAINELLKLATVDRNASASALVGFKELEPRLLCCFEYRPLVSFREADDD